MTTYTLQPQTAADLSTPYPLHVDIHGNVQRQDFWKGKISRVLGFQTRPDVQRIDLSWGEFLTLDPRVAEGRTIVAVDDEGNLFSWGGPLESVTVNADA